MKHFFEVFFIALTLVLAAFSQTALAIFSAMFCVIAWMWPLGSTGKSVEEIIAEANGAGGDQFAVEYNFKDDASEKFTVNIHHYGEKITKDEILKELVEYITDHTGIPVEADRLHVISYKKVEV